MMRCKAFLSVAAALFLVSTAAPASADPVKNIVLVHGAWVDASGWKPVYDILAKEGFNVTMVQEPETSFADDVTAAKRILDLQVGPTLLVGHSYGGSILTAPGGHPNFVWLVYVAAHAPDVGEDEGELGKKMPSVLRVVLYENDAGRGVFEYDQPSTTFGQFGDERVTAVARGLDAVLARALLGAAE